MVKDTSHFNCTFELESDLRDFTRELGSLFSEAKPLEIKELESALIHLASFREAAIALERKVLERKELERLAELATMERIEIEDVNGFKLSFDAPYGFEAEPEKTVYSADLYDVEMAGNQIVAARTCWPIHRDLTPSELAICNATFR